MSEPTVRVRDPARPRRDGIAVARREDLARLAVAPDVNSFERPVADDTPELEAAKRAVTPAPVRPDPNPVIIEHWLRLRRPASTVTAHERGRL